MEVILTKDQELGKKDAVVTVKDGYGQNFLIGKGLAILASKENIERRNERAEKIEKELKKSIEKSKNLKIAIYENTLTFQREGNSMKMFGSITNVDVSKALEEQGIEVPKNKIKLKKIYGFGEFSATVDCGNSIAAELSMYVEHTD